MPREKITFEIPESPFFVPPHVGGDADFWGTAEVTMSATLPIENGKELWLRLAMTASELGGDHTTPCARFNRPRGSFR